MQETEVVIIGGGATGIGVLRDLAMRGVSCVLFEQGGLAHGTSSRFHGLLHSGARYAVKDSAAARECIEENMILRTIGKLCVEETEGLFALTEQDDPNYVDVWVSACHAAGISAVEISVKEALEIEPHLAPDVLRVFRVPDSGIDGFRLIWHNAMSAKHYGAAMHTYTKVTDIKTANGQVEGVTTCNTITGETSFTPCKYIVNAAGPYSGEVARLAGLGVDLTPDRGTLIVFNHRFTSRVINRLHASGDGDIFVPHGSVTIFGTTSATAKSPADTAPTYEEVHKLLDLGEPLFPDVRNYRILRVFAGNRPLYTPPNSASGRGASRNFVIVDHECEGLNGMSSIFGGKLTTYRLMAEKMADKVCLALGVQEKCRTAEEPLVPEPSQDSIHKARKFFPAQGAELVAERTGNMFGEVVHALEKGRGTEVLCECEMVTKAEVELVAKDPSTHYLQDIRYRTRLGMGTCQGTFCSLRAIGALASEKDFALDSCGNARDFLRERWRGIRPALWGQQLQEIELGRAIFGGSLNLDRQDDMLGSYASSEAKSPLDAGYASSGQAQVAGQQAKKGECFVSGIEQGHDGQGVFCASPDEQKKQGEPS